MAARVQRMALVVVIVGLVGSCSLISNMKEPRALGPREHWLPQYDGAYCAGVGLTGPTLHGSPSDPRLAWMENVDGSRTELVWPRGFSARFDPQLVVLGVKDNVVALEGASITGSCGPDDQGAFSMDANSFVPVPTDPVR